MVLCISCASEIRDDCQYYQCSDMGHEIISTINESFDHEVDENGTMCDSCSTNILQMMYAAPGDSSVVHEIYELQHRHDQNICVWCQSSLFNRRTHNLPDRERQFIAERISPRNVSDDSVVCYGCWQRVRQTLQQQEVAMPPETILTSATTNSCIWCFRSLARTRRHYLPEGPERDEIISRIIPREIPEEACVCYACWVAARRNVQRAQNIDEARRNAVSADHHRGMSCALCSTSLFRRQLHMLPSGEETDAFVASIYPRELSGRFLCTNCWSNNFRRAAQQADQEDVVQENVQQGSSASTMELDEFRHTTNSSSHCFVPSCTNTERFCVPIYLRKRILNTQKVFVTENSRVCNEHKSLFNWEFLEQHEFTNSFTKNEMQSMLQLSVQEINNHLDLENINNIEDNIFKFWTGLTKENYNVIFNIIRPALTLTCKLPQTALGVFLIKARTGDSHRRIASLLCLSKSSITRLLNVAREALVNTFTAGMFLPAFPLELHRAH